MLWWSFFLGFYLLSSLGGSDVRVCAWAACARVCLCVWVRACVCVCGYARAVFGVFGACASRDWTTRGQLPCAAELCSLLADSPCHCLRSIDSLSRNLAVVLTLDIC